MRASDLVAGVYYVGVFNMDYFLHSPLAYSLQARERFVIFVPCLCQVEEFLSACSRQHCPAFRFLRFVQHSLLWKESHLVCRSVYRPISCFDQTVLHVPRVCCTKGSWPVHTADKPEGSRPWGCRARAGR